MGGREEFEAWLFINHISMMLYYKLYVLLQKAKLLNNFSPMDILLYGKQVRKDKRGKQWYTSEIPTKLKKLLCKIDIPVP